MTNIKENGKAREIQIAIAVSAVEIRSHILMKTKTAAIADTANAKPGSQIVHSKSAARVLLISEKSMGSCGPTATRRQLPFGSPTTAPCVPMETTTLPERSS